MINSSIGMASRSVECPKYISNLKPGAHIICLIVWLVICFQSKECFPFLNQQISSNFLESETDINNIQHFTFSLTENVVSSLQRRIINGNEGSNYKI